MENTILITGAAGFIGANLVLRLLADVENSTIIGLDNVNAYYDVSLKEYRLAQIEKTAKQYPSNRWQLIRGDLADKALIENIFQQYHPGIVVNLAAQAGVRYSIDHPDVYMESNIIGLQHSGGLPPLSG